VRVNTPLAIFGGVAPSSSRVITRSIVSVAATPAPTPITNSSGIDAGADTCKEVIPVTGHTAGSTLRTRPDSQT